MKVIITKCDKENSWYRDKIGKIFDVYCGGEGYYLLEEDREKGIKRYIKEEEVIIMREDVGEVTITRKDDQSWYMVGDKYLVKDKDGTYYEVVEGFFKGNWIKKKNTKPVTKCYSIGDCFDKDSSWCRDKCIFTESCQENIRKQTETIKCFGDFHYFDPEDSDCREECRLTKLCEEEIARKCDKTEHKKFWMVIKQDRSPFIGAKFNTHERALYRAHELSKDEKNVNFYVLECVDTIQIKEKYKKLKPITGRKLIEVGACEDEALEFINLFGLDTDIDLTEENMKTIEKHKAWIPFAINNGFIWRIN